MNTSVIFRERDFVDKDEMFSSLEGAFSVKLIHKRNNIHRDILSSLETVLVDFKLSVMFNSIKSWSEEKNNLLFCAFGSKS